MLARVDVQTEIDACRGWRYGVVVTRPDGRVSEHSVTLSWVDHDHWCGGRLAPSRVVEAVVAYLLEAVGGDLPTSFDAARARRIAPGIDRELRLPL